MDTEQTSPMRFADQTGSMDSTSPTRNFSQVEGPFASTCLPAVLRRSDRFEIRRILGCGAFGDVFLAHDRQLSRMVALKVPRAGRLEDAETLDQFLREARAAASLRHPGIVTVYDVHSAKDGIFIVLEFVEGTTLSEYVSQERPSFEEVARLLIDITGAVAYAHEHGLVHRDLKPSNILVDRRRTIRITDFGLAIHERGRRKQKSDVAGTPIYMAPEQVRGETHRLDGRTDIWSLGVILFWLLTGKRAFDGQSESEVFDEILNFDPQPPRQLVPEVPRELERICLRCLSKRMSDRYSSGQDLIDDLQHWVQGRSHLAGNVTASSPSISVDPPSVASVPILPKGLRSFDRHDADFYLHLLPGPYDRHGVPESVRFWKLRIEDSDPSSAFSVGLMYGPSGCGKTSLVRAGILPRLGSQAHSIYVEATSRDLPSQIRTALSQRFPEIAADLPLTEMLADVREGRLKRDDKVLLILDQFEQALNTGDSETESLLVNALRQCDGRRLQCIIVVRDDFSMAATRFMNALEIPIVEGHNCRAVDVFQPEHARKVLRHFGEAFGRLSPKGDGDGATFIREAVELLAQANVVTPVRLAAFAELTRNQDWNVSTLHSLGGSRGLGVALLESYLGDSVTNPTHRQHREAARRVLEALLPEDRDSIRGKLRSQSELMAASGYMNRPRDFAALVMILDNELRLITPADPKQNDPDETESAREETSQAEPYYQLAHDYLVPALHEWLTEKRRETRAGRAALHLETVSRDWNARPSVRRLPTLFEWASLTWWTNPQRWTLPQRNMMHAARRRHLARLGSFFLIALLGGCGLWFVIHQQQEHWRLKNGRAMMANLLASDASRLTDILADLDGFDSSAVREELHQVSKSVSSTADERLRAQLYLAPDDESARRALIERLASVGPDEHQVIVARLAPFAKSLSPPLWNSVHQADSDESLIRFAGALASWDPDSAEWQSTDSEVARALSRSSDPLQLPSWIQTLSPVRSRLVPPLSDRFTNEELLSAERRMAATALARFLAEEPAKLADIIVDADPDSFAIMLAELRQHPQEAIDALRARWTEQQSSGEASLLAARRQAVAAIALARLGFEDLFWSAMSGELSPDVRTAVIDRCSAYEVSPRLLMAHLTTGEHPSGRQAALIALAEYGPRLSPRTTDQLVETCDQIYREDSDPGVHAGAEYALRRLAENEVLASSRQVLAGRESSEHQWSVNPSDITMVRVGGELEFEQGSPASDLQRDEDEPLVQIRLPSAFEISAHEITLAQYHSIYPEFLYATKVTPTDDCPVNSVTWYDALKFCRKLSELEQVPETEMCYPPTEEIVPGLTLPSDWHLKTGYRLPTESEWEYACRANTSTIRFYGNAPRLLDRYAVFIVSSNDEQLGTVGSLRPNPWGLFDVYGNVLEWCHNTSSKAQTTGESATPSNNGDASILRSGDYRSVERENRSANRYPYPNESNLSFLGFRIARTVRE